MSYRVRASESVTATVRRMARDRLDDAVEALETAVAGDDVHGSVHEARKRAKQVRALTRLVRGVADDLHREVNVAVRDASRLLSGLRDREAILETLDDLQDGEELDGVAVAVAAIRPVLERDRDEVTDRRSDHLDDALAALVEVRDGVGDWDLPDGVGTFVDGFAKTYGRARAQLAEVRDDPTTEALHEWRKRVKYHRYHVRVLVPVWPTVLTAREDELHRLTDMLGDDHDLAVLRGVLDDHGDLDRDAARTLVAVLDRRRAELQRAALPLGRRLFVAPGDVMADQLAAWWLAWHEEEGTSDVPRPLDLTAAS